MQRLRFCKVDPSSLVPDHLEVGVLPPYARTAYPGVFLFTTVVRAPCSPRPSRIAQLILDGLRLGLGP